MAELSGDPIEDMRNRQLETFEECVVANMLKTFGLEKAATRPLRWAEERFSGSTRLTLARFAAAFPKFPLRMGIGQFGCAATRFPLSKLLSVKTLECLPFVNTFNDLLCGVEDGRKAALVFRWLPSLIVAIHNRGPDERVAGVRVVWTVQRDEPVVLEPLGLLLQSIGLRRAKGDLWGCTDNRIVSDWLGTVSKRKRSRRTT